MNISEAGNYGLALAGVVAGLGAISWGGKKARDLIRWAAKLGRTVDALNDLAQYELNHNGGGSIKDHAAKVPLLVEKVQSLDTSLADHLTASVEAKASAQDEQKAMWHAIEAVAKASPPEEP